MDVAQEARKHTATCVVRREEKTKERKEGQRKNRKRGLNSTQHSVVKIVRPATSTLLCSTSLCSILPLTHSLVSVSLFLIPTEGSIPQATDRFKTAFIVARCFFWLQEGLTLPHRSVAERIALPAVPCVCGSVCKYTCVRTYVNPHATCALFAPQIDVSSLPESSRRSVCICFRFTLTFFGQSLLCTVKGSRSMHLFVPF